MVVLLGVLTFRTLNILKLKDEEVKFKSSLRLGY